MGAVSKAGILCMIKTLRELSGFKGGCFMKISHCSFITDLKFRGVI